MRIYKTITIIGVILIPWLCYAQELSALWFNKLSELPNFAPSFNYFVYHDSEGFVWISSTAGLNRFDGTRVKHYSADFADSTSLFTGENIQSTFFEDSNKNLWFTTSEAIHCYLRSSDSFAHYQVKNKKGLLLETGYRAFSLEKDSFLWLFADSSIHRFNIRNTDANSFVTESTYGFFAADTTVDGSVEAVYRLGNIQGKNDQFWVIQHGKLIGPQKWFTKKNIEDAPAFISDVIKDSKADTWIGTDKGLVSWNPKSGNWKYIGGQNYGKCIVEPWGNQYLLVWSEKKGLLLFDKAAKTFSSIDVRMVGGPQVSFEDVFNIYVDKQDNLWVSLMGSGVVYANLNKTKFHAIQKKPDNKGNISYNYWAMLWDNRGNFWNGTNTGGLLLDNGRGKPVEQFRHKPGSSFSLPNDRVLCLMEDNKNRLWVGTQKGLSWVDSKRMGAFNEVLFDGTPDITVRGLLQLEQSTSILASTNQGLFLLKDRNGKEVPKRISKTADVFGILYEDKYGKIFCSRNDLGIDVFTFSNDSLHLISMLPIKNIITGYYEDVENNTLWISSLSGLAKVKMDGFIIDTILTEKNGLPDKNIHSMLADSQGNLWLGTPKGLAAFNIKSGNFRHYSLADGMQSSEFQLSACAKRQNGELWFGGTNGFTIVENKAIDSVMNKPVLKITGIKINDEEPIGIKDLLTGATNVNQVRNIKLPYDQNTISFEFAAIEYSDPTNNKLWYKLEGEDENWVELKKGEPGFSRYSNLWARNYTFWLKAANSDGVMSEPQAVLTLTVSPPFWYRWEFLLAMIAFLATAIWLFARYRIAQIREKAELNTRVAENKMAALRSQMNPHFVFNSLQTVNGFIARQDFRGAMEYINQFARLMRVILENSREGYISLEREIELLELYMKIESSRFSNPFTFSVTVGKEVDTYSMEIPSMLLQPFVENAIKHGLFHKKEIGHINIAFLKENGALKCVVEDNGVGRAKSTEINAQQGRDHKSRGLQIVNERLAIIGAAKAGNYVVKISDLLDRQHNPSGTRVEITLPLS